MSETTAALPSSIIRGKMGRVRTCRAGWRCPVCYAKDIRYGRRSGRGRRLKSGPKAAAHRTARSWGVETCTCEFDPLRTRAARTGFIAAFRGDGEQPEHT